MWTQQPITKKKKPTATSKHQPSLPIVVESWETSAGRMRTVVAQPKSPLQPLQLPCAVKAVDLAIVERKSTDCGEADDASFRSSKADSVVTAEATSGRGVTVEPVHPPVATEKTCLLSRSNSRTIHLAVPGYGTTHIASQDYAWHPASKPPRTPLLCVDGIPTPATLESGFYLPTSNLISTLATDNQLVELQQRQRRHAERGHHWPLTRLVWWILKPKTRRQYEPMSSLETWIMIVLLLVLVILVAAAGWSVWGDWMSGRWM